MIVCVRLRCCGTLVLQELERGMSRKGLVLKDRRGGERHRRFEGSMKDCKKKRGTKKDNVVEDDANDMDDDVEIDRGMKKSKNSSSFNVSAREVDEQGKRGAQFASKMQDNGKRVEDDVEIERGVKKLKHSRSFDDSAQEVYIPGKRRAKFASKLQEHEESCGDKSLSNARTSQLSASGITLDAKILEHLAPEFNDFDTKRAKRCFGAGQIWAIYDTLDAMPRFYALITKVISKDFKLQISWLEPYPHNANEQKWLYRGLPTSCGKFKLGRSETIEDHAIFSHLATCRKHINLPNIYEVHPRKGETWALFKNWNLEWYQNQQRNKVYEFEVVEILSDYDSGVGVSMKLLHKMKGFTLLFCRVKEEEVDFEVIPVKDRFRLSHRVPSVAMKCEEGLNGIKRFFELDPASLPLDLRCH